MIRRLLLCSFFLACSDDAAPTDGGMALDARIPSDGASADAVMSDGSNDTAVSDANYPVDSGPLPEGIPVPLSSVIESETRDRILITFDRNVGVIGAEGFTLRGTDSVTVTGASARGPVLTLELSAEIAYLQNGITWSYDDGAGGVHNLRSLRLIYVENRIEEPELGGTEYFVSSDGSVSNDGLSESSPWSIEHAVAQAGPGDKVWIRAGIYEDPQVDFPTDGTADARIVFEGYVTSTDGEPDPIERVSYEPNAEGTLTGEDLPLFRGVGGEGIAFLVRGRSFLTFRNLSFTNYRMAFLGNFHPSRSEGDPERAVRYCLFERIVGTRFGQGGGGGEDGAVVSLGLSTYNEYNTIRQSIAQDSTMVAFALGGRGSLLADSISYALRDDSASRESQDYYFSLKGPENVALRNRAHRMAHIEHGGHGFALRGEAPTMTEYNLLQDNEVINIFGAYELRNETSAYNVVRNCTSRVDGAINGESTGGLAFSGGAHHNLIEGHSARGVSMAIRYHSSTESATEENAHDNLVRNSEFYGMPEFEGSNGYSHKHAIHAETNYGGSVLANNRFIGCTFHDFSYFIRFAVSGSGSIASSGNEFIGSSISRGLFHRHPSTPADTGFAFRSSNLFEADSEDGGFGPFVGSDGNTSADPNYVDSDTFDFRPGAGSGLVDQGADHDDLLFDMNGVERPQGGLNDIGAFER